MKAITWMLAAVWVVVAAASLADSPLRVPALKTVCSANGKYCAVMDPTSGTTGVRRMGGNGGKIWSMEGWYRVAALTDDGDVLVTGYGGVNLLPLDYSPDLEILTFFKRGVYVKSVTLKEIFDDLSVLRRTVSHYHWGAYLGFDAEGRYLIETVDGRRIAYDVVTGKPVPLNHE